MSDKIIAILTFSLWMIYILVKEWQYAWIIQFILGANMGYVCAAFYFQQGHIEVLKKYLSIEKGLVEHIFAALDALRDFDESKNSKKD